MPRKRKCPEIMVLNTYEGKPDKNFWVSFPRADLPTSVVSKVNCLELKKIIDNVKDRLSIAQITRAEKSMKYLSNGAPSFQSKPLGPCMVKNSKAAIDNGIEVTDSIASWIKKGFVAGPFKTPPLPNFRSNSILAIPQPDKVRICINVSLPADVNLNSNLKKNSLEKIEMTSAKLFSYVILECGTDSILWKFDFEDAYKNVPIPVDDYYLQGFCWQGAYFVELKLMFGSAASVQNFDIVANTVKTCSKASCEIPSKLVHRQLDDVPVVVPKNSNWGTEFEKSYRDMCKKIGMILAPDCPKFEKAFSNSTFGKILGIFFDTKNLTWRLPDEKIEKNLKLIAEIENKELVSLLEMQQLMGNLNHIGQMCPFLLNFRFNLNKSLALFVNESEKITLSEAAGQELNVWKNFLLSEEKWFPICHPVSHPPICTKIFFTDAAGFPKTGIWKENIGCGVIGLGEDSDTILAYQTWWPKKFITEMKDYKGVRFGDKTSTLEQIAILLPFLLIPEKLKNQHIVIRTDNIACVFGHQNRLMKGDECASIFIRCVHLISAFLGSVVHVEHLPRCSNWESSTADSLSRQKTTGFLEGRLLSRWTHLAIPKEITDWFVNPVNDWEIPYRILEYVQEKTWSK
jgi:hypothetical protein